jgi:hypothetical protein
MGMGPHVDAGACGEPRGAHMIEKNKGADHLVRVPRKQASDLEPSEIFRMRFQKFKGGHVQPVMTHCENVDRSEDRTMAPPIAMLWKVADPSARRESRNSGQI